MMPEQEAIRIGSLFSGIGGLELGLERATGGRVAWQVEQDEWCRRVLARHWPEAQRFDDVRKVGARELAPVEVICGGFPCQDISNAGKGAGLAGERSGLWREYARIVRELRPRVVVAENVAALLARGLDVVLGDLAALGYDALWDCVPAAAVGAPHRRDRLFVVAYADGVREPQPSRREFDEQGRPLDGGEVLADAAGERRPDAQPGGLSGHAGARRQAPDDADDGSGRGAAEPGLGRVLDGFPAGLDRVRRAGHRWPARPGEAQHPWEAPRTARGVPDRPRRLKALGNAVCPQVAEVVGHVVRELLALESSR